MYTTPSKIQSNLELALASKILLTPVRKETGVIGTLHAVNELSLY